MNPVCRKTDQHSCPIPGHAVTPIVSVASQSTVDGLNIAAVGDKTGCGATIIQGSSAATVDGKPVAYLGCATDHGGSLITGSPTQKVAPQSLNILQSLINQIKACDICADYLPRGPRPVFQCDPGAKILVAAQAPGWRVHETGLPFNDPSGDRLRDWMGIDRDTFYNPKKLAIIPMGFCYPGTGKSGDLPPRSECAQTWRAPLLGLLLNIELTLVMGQYAQAWHLKGRQQRNLTATVKAWRAYWPDILPLPHPSPRNNLWLKKNPWFDKELVPLIKQRVNFILK